MLLLGGNFFWATLQVCVEGCNLSAAQQILLKWRDDLLSPQRRCRGRTQPKRSGPGRLSEEARESVSFLKIVEFIFTKRLQAFAALEQFESTQRKQTADTGESRSGRSTHGGRTAFETVCVCLPQLLEVQKRFAEVES